MINGVCTLFYTCLEKFFVQAVFRILRLFALVYSTRYLSRKYELQYGILSGLHIQPGRWEDIYRHTQFMLQTVLFPFPLVFQGSYIFSLEGVRRPFSLVS